MANTNNTITASTQGTTTCKFTNLKLFSYAGSKYNFKNHFHNILEKMGIENVGTYIEAFAGSLASMFHILEIINADKIVINDFNPKIINLYEQIMLNPEQVWQGYKKIEDRFNSLKPIGTKEHRIYPKKERAEIVQLSDFFKYIREELNTNKQDYVNASCWLFVMNHNFNGLYNENKKGKANISFNWSTKEFETQKIKEAIFNLSHFLNTNNVVFENLDIDLLISKYNDHDSLIYLDPPYIRTKIQYNQSREGTKKKKSNNSFQDIETHLKMIDSCSKYKYVMYSNNHDKGFIDSFDEYINFTRRGNISSKSKKAKLEILAYKINGKTPINNKTYNPKPVNNVLEVKNVVNGDPIFTTGTICSGCGASEESLKQLGFNEDNHRNLFMCEWDEEVSDVYKMNFKSENYFGDFYKVDWSKVEKTRLSILFISTPCQEFSLAGSRRNLDSEKGQLFIDALKKARELSPDRIIEENVTGLLNSGRHFSKIKDKEGNKFELNYIPAKKELEKKGWKILKAEKDKYIYTSYFNPNYKIGRTMYIVEEILKNEFSDYNIYLQKLNTKDFNTPQNRDRVFIVMIKKHLDLGFEFPKEQKLTTTVKDLLEKNVSEKYTVKNREFIPYNKPQPKNPKQLYHYGEQLNTDGTKSTYRSSKSIYFPHIIPCQMTKGEIKIFVDNKVRFLSPTEMKRLHGFGEDYKLPENYALNRHIMGNTISPSVLKNLIRNILFMDTQKSNTSNYQGQEETLVS